MLRFSVSTPMLVIDGQRGPLETGTLPMYEIPAVLLELLHITEPTIMDYTRAPQGMRIRPLAGLHINLFEDGAVELCREPPFGIASMRPTSSRKSSNASRIAPQSL